MFPGIGKESEDFGFRWIEVCVSRLRRETISANIWFDIRSIINNRLFMGHDNYGYIETFYIQISYK